MIALGSRVIITAAYDMSTRSASRVEFTGTVGVVMDIQGADALVEPLNRAPYSGVWINLRRLQEAAE